MYDILELNDKLVNELKEIARLMSIPNYDELRKQELIYKILDQQALNRCGRRRRKTDSVVQENRRLRPSSKRIQLSKA